MSKNPKNTQTNKVLIAGKEVKVATANEVKTTSEKAKKKFAKALENLKNR